MIANWKMEKTMNVYPKVKVKELQNMKSALHKKGNKNYYKRWKTSLQYNQAEPVTFFFLFDFRSMCKIAIKPTCFCHHIYPW